MSRRLTKFIAAAGLLCAGGAQAQEIRTPLNLYRGVRNFRHYNLPRIEDKKWSLDAFAAGYSRVADKAYLAHSNDAKELGALFFARQSFRISDAFPCQGEFADFSKHPCLALTEITPNLEYTETGTYLGLDFEDYAYDNDLHLGFRFLLPFRDIKVENNACCNSNGCLQSVRSFQREKVRDTSGNIVQSYAYRLDFLSTLDDVDAGAPASPLVKYNNADADGNITIVEQDVSKNKGVTVIRSDNGTTPSGRWGTIRFQLGALPLRGDGTGVVDGQRGEFVDGTSYSALGSNRDTQADYWVVPTYENDGVTITGEAAAIRNAVELAVQSIEDVSAEDFLFAHDITLDSQRNRGTGDLRTEFYAGCDMNECLYGELQLAVAWPTSKLQKKPGKTLQVAPGNNGHLEVQAGFYAGIDACDWLKIGIDGLYSHALERDERRAATFFGSRVKGIGPVVKARVDWSWFLGHINFTVLHPKNLELGANLGYELYLKGEDNVRFREKCTRDLLGNLASLDSNVIKSRTDVVAHKVNLEVFRRFDFLEIFAGSSYTFFGRNATRDGEVHLGLNINANWDCLFSF